jgi:hypothetical protein
MDKKYQDECEGYHLSSCCGAVIINHDLCGSCLEHCDSQCSDCTDIETCGDVE